jgi:predicted kinase
LKKNITTQIGCVVGCLSLWYKIFKMIKTPKILILVGCPCSGKSTFAEYYSKFNDVVRVNRDEMRMMMKFTEFLESEDEVLLSKMIESMVETALRKGRNVLIDNTHTKKEFINQLIQKFNHLAEIEFKVLDVPLPELLRRNALRERKIPVNVIKEMYQRLESLKQNFDFSPRPQTGVKSEKTAIAQDFSLPKAILCDLDGTLAQADGRNMFRPSEEEMYADRVVDAVATALKGFANDHKIIFLSGREDLYAEVSKRWIREKAGIENFELWMRKEGDSRKDSIVKEEILRGDILPKYYVTGVFDDRMQVCRMWYEQGIFCFNVNQGLIEF